MQEESGNGGLGRRLANDEQWRVVLKWWWEKEERERVFVATLILFMGGGGRQRGWGLIPDRPLTGGEAVR
jgi:hypothetical protein